MVRPPYPAAVRLYAIAADRWAEIDAAYVTVDLLREPSYRFLNLVYAWCVQRIPPDDLEQWIMNLHAPLPGEEVTRRSDKIDEIEGESFMAAMGQLKRKG